MRLGELKGYRVKRPTHEYNETQLYAKFEDGDWCYYTGYSTWSAVKGKLLSNAQLMRTDWYPINTHGEDISHLITKTKPKEAIMAQDKNYIGGEYKIAKVTYELNTQTPRDVYNFKADIDLEVNEGDIVVVDSSNGLSVCKVIKVLENCVANKSEVAKATAWVVNKVDMSRHQAKIEATEQREYILQQLEERKKALEAVNQYELLAKIDPESAKLVEQLTKLGK